MSLLWASPWSVAAVGCHFFFFCFCFGEFQKGRIIQSIMLNWTCYPNISWVVIFSGLILAVIFWLLSFSHNACLFCQNQPYWFYLQIYPESGHFLPPSLIHPGSRHFILFLGLFVKPPKLPISPIYPFSVTSQQAPKVLLSKPLSDAAAPPFAGFLSSWKKQLMGVNGPHGSFHPSSL